MTPKHEIILVQTAEQRQECYDVRIAVFHLEQKFPLETEIDEPVIPFLNFMEDKATHFLLRLTPSLTPIGTIRACEIPGPESYYKLTRLAVLKDYRKYNFGRTLVLTLHEWVRRHALQAAALGPVKIICHSQLPVKGFYSKFGYESEVSLSPLAGNWLVQDLGSLHQQGDEFDEDGDPHQKMVFWMPLGPSSMT